jgi:hypothetical protein
MDVIEDWWLPCMDNDNIRDEWTHNNTRSVGSNAWQFQRIAHMNEEDRCEWKEYFKADDHPK